MKFVAEDIDQLTKPAEALISLLKEHKIICLEAEMGTGKTTFVSKVVELCNSTDTASSPTFSLVNEYSTQKIGTIYHFDFYRIDSIEEAMDMGVEEYLYSGNPCLIEWPEKIEELLPSDIYKIKLSLNEQGHRLIEFFKNE